MTDQSPAASAPRPMDCDSRDQFPKFCVGVAVVIYPCGEATSFHCYPCSVEIEKASSDDQAKPFVMAGEQERYDRQKKGYERWKLSGWSNSRNLR